MAITNKTKAKIITAIFSFIKGLKTEISTAAPTIIKNMGINTSATGFSLSSISVFWFVLANSSPAAKAPIIGANPANCAKNAKINVYDKAPSKRLPRALRLCIKINNLVVGTPYLDEINTKEAEFLYKKGFSILNIQGLNLSHGIEFGAVTPEYWIKFAEEINEKSADAIFLSCGGIRSTEVIQEIEYKTGKPVITSNQAQMWSCLRKAGIEDKISGFGELFNHQLNFL